MIAADCESTEVEVATYRLLLASPWSAGGRNKRVEHQSSPGAVCGSEPGCVVPVFP